MRQTFAVERGPGGAAEVASALGSVALVELPRFPDPSASVPPGSLLAPMPGTVTRVLVQAGQSVDQGQLVLVLEAMKMEHPVHAPSAGTVDSLPVTAGQQVDGGSVLAVLSLGGSGTEQEQSLMPGPLHGLRVVELAGLGPAPFAAMLLADLGADVIRVDRPGRSSWPADPQLDLLQRGQAVASSSTSSRPTASSSSARLAGAPTCSSRGTGPASPNGSVSARRDCSRDNPRLVYGRMTGWGQDGPLADRAGHDIAYIALTGALHAIGRAGGPPQVPLNLSATSAAAALYLLLGVCSRAVRGAAQRARAGGRRGDRRRRRLADGDAVRLPRRRPVAGPPRQNLLDTGAPFYDVYETSDGG